MNQPSRFHHIYRSGFCPAIQLVPIDTLMRRRIGHRDAAFLVPFKGDEAHITVAHGRLPEEVDAVLVVEPVHLAVVLAEVCKVVIRVHELVDALEAVDLVVHVERAEEATAVGHSHPDVLASEFFHVFILDDDVLSWWEMASVSVSCHE